MTSILQTATSAVKNEIAFNSHCREIAKNNLSLARNYVKSTFTGTLACPDPSRKITTSIGLKDRCINFIKAPLLLLRAPLLYLPLINRVTQLALRFLSPRKAWNFVISCPFQCCSQTELKIRYNENALIVFKAGLLLIKNIRENNEFNPLTFADENLLNAYIKLSSPLSIDLINSPKFKENQIKARYSEDTRRKFIEGYFKDKIAQKETFDPSGLSLFGKLGFNSEECLAIFTQLSPELSINFVNSPEFKEDEIKARYSKEACCKFVGDHFISKIRTKETINKSDLDLSKEEEAIFINKLGFTRKECEDIFLNVLAQHPEIKCSVNLKKCVNTCKK